MTNETVSDILIGIKKELSSDLEYHLKDMRYTKETSFDDDFFTFQYKDWNNPEDTFVTAFMTYLLSVVKYNQYGFIRISTEPGDVEIHGNLENFGISYTQEVHY